MKKLSLAIAAVAIFTTGAFAQDGTKAKAKEPVKVTNVHHEERGEKVPVATSPAPANPTPAPAPAKKKLVKKTVVAKGDMQAHPVNAEKRK